MRDMAEETIIDYITCPECLDFIQPPSECCENGHFVCHSCRKKDYKCPICNTQNYPNKDNAVFNLLLKEIYFPCHFQENGCSAYFKCDELKKHHLECQFRFTPCAFRSSGCMALLHPDEKAFHEEICEFGITCRVYAKFRDNVYRKCDWRGDRNSLPNHVIETHKSAWTPHKLESNVALSWMLPIDFNFEKTELIHLRDIDEMFYFYSKSVEHSKHYVAVQYIGNSDRAKLFKYSVEFMYDSKMVKYEDVVLPYNLSVEEVYNSNNCFYVEYDFLKKHFQAERIIDCYVKVYRKDQSPTEIRRYMKYLDNTITEE